MKKVFLFISIGIILLAIPVSVFLVGKNQELRQRAAPATTLSFEPTSITKNAGETFTLEVKIDTAENQIAVIQMHILYDPAKLQAVDITNGPLAPSIRASGKIDSSGIASITVGARDNTAPITGTGTVAIIAMKALTSSANPVTVKFAPHPDTYANALNEESNNVLVGTSATNVTILNADGTQPVANQPDNNTATESAVVAHLPQQPAPTPDISQNASTSAQTSASPSAVVITSLTENENVTTQTPLIQGKGVPGSTITITIHSDSQQTATVQVDANGNWSYVPTTPLDPGPHNIQAMTTNPTTGQTQTATTAIVVSGGTGEEATGSAVPVTGNIDVTMLLIALGTLVFVSGATLPLFIR